MAQTMVCDSAAAEVGAWGLQIAMTLSLQPVVSLSLSLFLSLCVCPDGRRGACREARIF